jgi:hypothetical protein
MFSISQLAWGRPHYKGTIRKHETIFCPERDNALLTSDITNRIPLIGLSINLLVILDINLYFQMMLK